MKKLLLIPCLIYFQAQAQNEKTISNTDINEVKVFQAGAQVNRTVKSSVEAGVTLLKLDGLSANINKNSISVSGTGDVVILSVDQELNYLQNERKSAEQKKLEDSLEVLQFQLEKAGGLTATYNDEQALLLANKSVGGANVGVSMENLQKVADFFRNRMTDIRTKLLEIHKEQKKLNEKIARIQKQLNELNAKRNQPTSIITVTVSAKARTTISLEVSYYVTGAGWTPHYDIRSKDINSPVQLAYKADVFQQTGEHWENVKMKLSTGNPSQGGSKPALSVWHLDFYNPIYKNKVHLINPGSAATQRTLSMEEIQSIPSMDGNEAVAVKSVSDYTRVNENQLSTDFDIAIKYTVPSDGKIHTVDIQSYNLQALYSYFAIPKLDKDAFLVARITGWEELNLMPGKANIYFENGYVGESFIDPRETKDTLELSLGRDKKIIIKREQKKDLSSKKFIGSNVEKELKYVITIRNTKKEKINITIEDQVPVSKNNDIVVKLGDYSGGAYNEETGKITWKTDVAPAASVEKNLDFSVKYPKDKIINGL